MTIPTLVEIVAREIFDAEGNEYPWEAYGEDVQKGFREMAQAAITAHLAALHDAGMVVVPREPTEAMIRAWANASPVPEQRDTSSLSDDEASRVWATADWQAMITAGQEG